MSSRLLLFKRTLCSNLGLHSIYTTKLWFLIIWLCPNLLDRIVSVNEKLTAYLFYWEQPRFVMRAACNLGKESHYFASFVIQTLIWPLTDFFFSSYHITFITQFSSVQRRPIWSSAKCSAFECFMGIRSSGFTKP